MNEKRKRVVNKELLDDIRNLPCLHCNRVPSHPHHVKTRGAGGGDILQNLMPLCTEAHTAIHMTGISAFANKYPKVEAWLYEMRWKYDAVLLRWEPPFR